MSTNLMLALAAEHKQRTGHDVWAQGPLAIEPSFCDVCLHLHAEKRHQEEMERQHYEEMEREEWSLAASPTPTKEG